MMRRIGSGVAISIERLVGRRNLVRASRLLLDHARLDLPNRMSNNGEWMVQDTVLATGRSESLVAFDVGANVGDWSHRLLSEAARTGKQVRVHAFEPAAATFDELRGNLLPAFAGSVTLTQGGVSDHAGGGTLYKVHEMAGSNSIHGVAGTTDGMSSETISLCTLEGYCASTGVDSIDLLKIDTEGHDHLVLTGARDLLVRGAIDVIQFEYNHRWIGARRYLKDVFDYLPPLGYEIGKVTSGGIEWYGGWSPELETFREGNYLAVRSASRGRFPSVAWWLDQ